MRYWSEKYCMGKMYYKLLYKIFNFDEWHVSVIGERPYAMEVVKYINRFLRENTEYKRGRKVVEIGCGLGDIVS